MTDPDERNPMDEHQKIAEWAAVQIAERHHEIGLLEKIQAAAQELAGTAPVRPDGEDEVAPVEPSDPPSQEQARPARTKDRSTKRRPTPASDVGRGRATPRAVKERLDKFAKALADAPDPVPISELCSAAKIPQTSRQSLTVAARKDPRFDVVKVPRRGGPAANALKLATPPPAPLPPPSNGPAIERMADGTTLEGQVMALLAHGLLSSQGIQRKLLQTGEGGYTIHEIDQALSNLYADGDIERDHANPQLWSVVA